MFLFRVKQNRELIDRSVRIYELVYQLKNKILRYVISISLLLVGVISVFGERLSVVVVFIGCILFSNTMFRNRVRTDLIMEDIDNGNLQYTYNFRNDYILIEYDRDSRKVLYPELRRLVIYEGTYFLYEDKYTCIALPSKSMIKGTMKFEAFIEKKTGLCFERPVPLTRISWKYVFNKLKDTMNALTEGGK